MSMDRVRSRAIAVCGAKRCDARTEAAAEELGRLIVQAGYTLVCGGMGGVMEAACRGGQSARRGGGAGVVVGILPVSELDGGNPYCDVAIPTGMGAARNALVALSADAVILVGGGSGTLSEAAFAWQFGKPVVALATSGGWAERLAGQAIDDGRPGVVLRADTPEEALTRVVESLR